MTHGESPGHQLCRLMAHHLLMSGKTTEAPQGTVVKVSANYSDAIKLHERVNATDGHKLMCRKEDKVRLKRAQSYLNGELKHQSQETVVNQADMAHVLVRVLEEVQLKTCHGLRPEEERLARSLQSILQTVTEAYSKDDTIVNRCPKCKKSLGDREYLGHILNCRGR